MNAPTKEEMIQQAKVFISKHLNVPPDLDEQSDLKSLGLDSFRIIELVLFIERKTGKTFPEHAYTPSNLKSIESIVNCFSGS